MLDADADHVLIRMYNVGFGDCFLLVFPASDRPRKVLIDCGSHSAGRGPASIQDVCARVLSDVAGDGGVARIDLVIATHRHQDHVFVDAIDLGGVTLQAFDLEAEPLVERDRACVVFPNR